SIVELILPKPVMVRETDGQTPPDRSCPSQHTIGDRCLTSHSITALRSAEGSIPKVGDHVADRSRTVDPGHPGISLGGNGPRQPELGGAAGPGWHHTYRPDRLDRTVLFRPEQRPRSALHSGPRPHIHDRDRNRSWPGHSLGACASELSDHASDLVDR